MISPCSCQTPSRLTLLKAPKKKGKRKKKRERKDDDVAWDKKSRWKKKLSAKYGTCSLKSCSDRHRVLFTPRHDMNNMPQCVGGIRSLGCISYPIFFLSGQWVVIRSTCVDFWDGMRWDEVSLFAILSTHPTLPVYLGAG